MRIRPPLRGAPGCARPAGLALLTVLLVGCGHGGEGCELAVGERLPTTAPDSTTSYRLAEPVVNGSYSGVRRLAASIFVAGDRDAGRIEATLRRAANEIAAACEDPDVLFVYAFRPHERPGGAYTVGRALHAPGGEWPAEDLDAPKRITVTLHPSVGDK